MPLIDTAANVLPLFTTHAQYAFYGLMIVTVLFLLLAPGNWLGSAREMPVKARNTRADGLLEFRRSRVT
jgi:hypothetical protein